MLVPVSVLSSWTQGPWCLGSQAYTYHSAPVPSAVKMGSRHYQLPRDVVRIKWVNMHNAFRTVPSTKYAPWRWQPFLIAVSPKPDDNKCLANEPSESRPPSPPSPAHQDQILFGLQPGGHVDSHVNLLHYHFTLRCPLVMKRGLVFPDSSSLRVHLINTKRLGSV